MSEGSDYVLRLVANEEAMPVETDAPEQGSEIAYDAGLQVELLEHGPDALQEFGMIVVRGCGDEARYNSAVWFALGQGLVYELKDSCVVITDPKAE